MERKFLLGTFRVEKQDYLSGCSSLLLEILHCNDPKSRVPFTFQPDMRIRRKPDQNLSSKTVPQCNSTQQNKEEKCDVRLPWWQNFWITTIGSLSNDDGVKPRFSKSLDLQISSLNGYFKNIDAISSLVSSSSFFLFFFFTFLRCRCTTATWNLLVSRLRFIK